MDNKSHEKEQILQDLEAAQQEIEELKIELGKYQQSLEYPNKDIEFYRTVFEQSPLGIGIVTSDSRLMYANSKLCDMLGYTLKELEKLKLADFSFIDDIKQSEYFLEQLFQREIPSYQLEKRYLKKDGSIFWGNVTVTIVCDENGEILYSVGMIEDITQRKQAEAKLQKSEHQISNILNLAADGIISINEAQEIILFNQGAEKIFGYKATEVIGQPIDILLPLPIAQNHRQYIHDFAEHPMPSRYMGERNEITGQRKTGDVFPAEASIMKVKSDEETTFTVIIRDITNRKQVELELQQLNAKLDQRVWERTSKLAETNEHLQQEIEKRVQAETALKQAHDELEQRVLKRTADLEKTNATLQAEIKERKQVEDALRHSQQLLKTTFDSLEEAVFVLEASTRTILSVNKAVERMFGYTEAEVLGQNTEFLYVDREAYLEFGRRQAIAMKDSGVLKMEFQVRRKDGTIIESEHTVTQMLDEFGNRFGLVGVVRDISQRKQAKEALQRSEARLKEAQAISHLGNWELDLQANDLSWSDEVFRIFEIDQEKFGASYEAFLDAIHPDDRDKVNEAYTNSLETKQPYEITHRLRMKDGRIKWLHEQCQTFYNEDGQALRSIGVVRDITQRKQAEDALRESERSLKEAQAQAQLGHWKYDMESQKLSGSDEFFRIYGLPQDETDLDVFISLIHPDDFERFKDLFQRAINKSDSWDDVEYRLAFQDGTVKHINSRGEAITDETGNLIALVGTTQDITQRKHAEIALLEQEGLRVALAKEKEHNALKDSFMSMISHEFRTPLAIIKTSSQLLEYYADKITPENQQVYLERISSQITHLTEMLDNVALMIQAQTNPIQFNPQTINLKDFCSNLVEGLQNTIGIDHILDFTSEDGLEEFVTDPKLLHIILMNLLSNAIKYSPKGKTIYFDVFQQGNERVLQVRDEGVGISPEDQKRLFEPYFRSKNVENVKGIGLGLKIVRDFVELHQGRIEMNSTFGEGTVFTVYLPESIPVSDLVC